MKEITDIPELEKFKRCEGHIGSEPQNFVDFNFKVCPFCRSINPNWTVAQIYAMTDNRYYFKCSECGCIISVMVWDAIHYRKKVSFQDKINGKMLGLRCDSECDIRIDSVGSKSNSTLLGTKISVSDLQNML